jgi:hypothetical protein
MDDLQSETQRNRGLFEQLQGVVSGARLNLNAGEAQEYEELFTKFHDIFATKRPDYLG